jgi:hypothetical protein
MPPFQRTRFDAWFPAVLLFTGSALFLGAGRHHPIIDASFGTVGSDEFFRAFARHMLSMPNWESIHLGILLGPVLWALAAAGVGRMVFAKARALADVGRTALLLGAVLWAVAFVLDGYVGPRLAKAIVVAGVGADALAITTFSTNQFTMARLGMLSMVLMGGSILAFSAALLVQNRMRSWGTIVGGLGLLLGGWTLIATGRGDFWPGPFTSPYWTATAIALGLWFVLLGTTVPGMRRAPNAQATCIDARSSEVRGAIA